MAQPLASIVIPTYNHAQWLPDAIRSAASQTVPVEVIVIDDGSTDDTASVLGRPLFEYSKHVNFISVSQPHRGPSAARNDGIAVATAPYVMFLDADDVIEPTKIERQLEAFDDSIGWVLCDVRIEDEARGVATTASERYRYPQRNLGGWIAAQLEPANFIPCMSPLVRTSVLHAHNIRFLDRPREDWEFWYHVARVARVRYVPDVLATYRKRRGGRNSVPDVAVPPAEPPLRLNLGCGTPGALSWHPMPGLVNLDRSLGWCFEDGLGQFADNSVDGISISHALMYVDVRDWPRVFADFARVLRPGGVIRITEDDALNPKSARYGGWRGSEPAVTLTSAAFVGGHLESVGLNAREVDSETTHYRDRSLMQAQHGAPPDVFFIEGIKP